MKPSVFTQLEDCTQVGAKLLMDSPRHWNPGLLRYRDKLWMCYRYHLKDAASRCATAICELDAKTFQPNGKSQRVPFHCATGDEHHEDARLFMFRGEPHISYNEMRGYKPGNDYTCAIKYAKLRLHGSKWGVVEEWHPNYGKNSGHAKEKNWVFFEHEDTVHCIYADHPRHVVLRLVGGHITNSYESPAPTWHFGQIRGGTQPVRMADGNWLVIFHSSIPTEIAPHYIRYYAGSYVFSAKPPFECLQISTKPVMVGSEVDGHKVDPRYVAGWKPFVAFPSGLVPDGDSWICSLGVNDWSCAVGRLREKHLQLGAVDGSDIRPRYFKRPNGSIPVLVLGEGGRKQPVEWIVPRTRNAMTSQGYMMLSNPMQAESVAEVSGVIEVTADEYERALSMAMVTR